MPDDEHSISYDLIKKYDKFKSNLRIHKIYLRMSTKFSIMYFCSIFWTFSFSIDFKHFDGINV